MPEETARSAHILADALIDQLVASGVTRFFVAPGSRSTPLAMAVARHPDAQAFVHFDERGTAFMALGAARATAAPAAWITTSGTAVANGFPAVIEAATDAVPMILLTADRPAELRHSGANQTIDQVKIFGDNVRWFVDLPVPDAFVTAAFVRSTAAHAVARSLAPDAGPVHLNCMFREPLAPPSSAPWERRTDARRVRTEQPRLVPDDAAVEGVVDALTQARRGVVVAGRMGPDDQPSAVAGLAEALGWPLIVDIGSQLRLGSVPSSNRLAHFDAMLASGGSLPPGPDTILHFGSGLVSKRTSAWLAASPDAVRVSVRAQPQRLDPFHDFDIRVHAEPGPFAHALRGAGIMPPHRDYLDSLSAFNDEAAQRLAAEFDASDDLTEPSVAHHLSRLVRADHVLVLGNSMPVRDADTFSVADGAPIDVVVNRGASGIDGTVATAVGVAEATDRPVTLLCGDLTLLHDLNSLAAATRSRRPIHTIVINNDGGGIFSFLPVAHHEQDFERFFGTPHRLQFEHAAHMFGLGYQTPRDVPSFKAAYEGAIRGTTSTIIEVTTDRRSNVSEHRRLFELLAAR